MFRNIYFLIKIEFEPSIVMVAGYINNVMTVIMNCISTFPRLPEVLNKKKSNRLVCE